MRTKKSLFSGRRWTSASLALLLLFTGIFAAMPPQTALAKAVISATATADSNEVQPGSNVTISVHVTSSETVAGMIDLEIYNSSYQRVGQIVVDPVPLTANETKNVPIVWEVPASLAKGQYIVSAGVFGSGWNSEINEWFAGLTTLQIGGGNPGEDPGEDPGENPGEGPGENPPPGTLPVPANLSAIPDKRLIKLNWSAVDQATNYELEVDGTVIDTGAATSYEHAGLQPDSSHTYRVRAKNAEAASDWSTAVTARTLSEEPLPVSDITVHVETGTETTSPMIGPDFTISNNGNKAVKLSDLKIRYYFTADYEDKPLTVDFWSTVPKENALPRLVVMNIPGEQADTFLEFGFKPEAGSLNPGSSVLIGTWINNSGWDAFDQTNDYSFNRSEEMAPSTKVTAFLNGELVWGEEPEALDLPPFPSGIKATPADTSVTLTWEPVEGAVSYTVLADGKPFEVTGPSFTHDLLRPGTLHTYKLKTKTATRDSVWSAPLSARTTGQQIPAPTQLKAAKTNTSITLTWQSPPDTAITGYDVEVDGQLLDNGLSTTYKHDGLEPGTAHSYRVRAKNDAALGVWTDLLTQNTTRTPTGPFDVQINVDPSKDRAPISPYIYGTNDDLTGTEKWTSRRIGGNRLTTYNWENNASNTGKEEGYHSDNYVAHYYGGLPWHLDPDKPAIGVTGFHEKSLAMGADYTLATVQAAGYVAKDANGTVNESESVPSSRWAEVKAEKDGPLSLTPDLNDNYVYMDEMVNYLVHKFGNASTPTGIRGYEIDNEPGLWQSNHGLIHPEATGAEEVLTKGIAAAKAIKKVDPYAEVFGPAAFGFDDMYAMMLAPDWRQLKGNYDWYVDYYLDEFRKEGERQGGKRLLDVMDFHWYPETSGGGYRIHNPNGNNVLETNLARIQSPRQFWDPSYNEGDSNYHFRDYGQFFPLLPRIQQSIDQYYPDTKIAITEYNFGAEGNVYGGIAQADTLGIFGKFGVYVAHFWRMTNGVGGSDYITAAFKLFNDYDGNGSKYGDTKIQAETSDIENSSVYGSVFRDNDNNLHLIVLNKNHEFEMNANFNIAGETTYKSARVYAFDGESYEVTEREPVTNIQDNVFSYTVPKLTACHIVLTANPQ